MWSDIKKVLHQNQNFLLATHINPDGDGVGAACALTELLIHLDKNIKFLCDKPLPQRFHFLDYHATHEIYDPSNDYSEFEVLIVLDAHNKQRIGKIAQLLDQYPLITVCIDHHEVAETFADYAAIDPNACSSGAMIYDLYKDYGYALDLQAATGIYTSVICDTGRFSHSSTSRIEHKIADECIKIGVDPDTMHSRLFQHVTLSQIKMFAQALQGMETYLNNKVIIEQISLADIEKIGGDILDIENIDLDYILEFNKLIEDVQCIVLLRELPNNQVRVSLRSTGGLDIGKIMRKLGGGGHPNAAGLSWKGSAAEVKKLILDSLSELIHEQEVVNQGLAKI